MTKSLTENTWLYTDKGIENVHWCNVDGVDELVTPKGKVLAPVPSYDHFSQLVKKVEKLEQQLAEANELIKDYGDEYPMVVKDYLNKWGVK